MNHAPPAILDAPEPADDATSEVVLLLGDLGRGGLELARALGSMGYAIRREVSVGALLLQSMRPPVAVLVECGPGRDPFRAVRWMRTQPRYAHVLIVVYAPLGELRVGEAIAAGADDLVDETALHDAVARVASRIARARVLEDRALFDCVAQIHNRRFVAERLTTEIACALDREGCCAFGAILVRDWHDRRAHLGWRSADRAIEELAFETRAVLRPADVAARLSDDEVLVLLPGLDARAAEARFAAPAGTGALACERVFVDAPDDGVTWQDLFDCASRRRRVERSAS